MTLHYWGRERDGDEDEDGGEREWRRRTAKVTIAPRSAKSTRPRENTFSWQLRFRLRHSLGDEHQPHWNLVNQKARLHQHLLDVIHGSGLHVSTFMLRGDAFGDAWSKMPEITSTSLKIFFDVWDFRRPGLAAPLQFTAQPERSQSACRFSPVAASRCVPRCLQFCTLPIVSEPELRSVLKSLNSSPTSITFRQSSKRGLPEIYQYWSRADCTIQEIDYRRRVQNGQLHCTSLAEACCGSGRFCERSIESSKHTQGCTCKDIHRGGWANHSRSQNEAQ